MGRKEDLPILYICMGGRIPVLLGHELKFCHGNSVFPFTVSSDFSNEHLIINEMCIRDGKYNIFIYIYIYKCYIFHIYIFIHLFIP